MKKVLVTFGPDEEDKYKLRDVFTGYEVVFDESNNAATLNEEAKVDVEIIIGNIAATKLNQFPNLKWLQLISAGTDTYTADVLGNTILTNASGTYGCAVPEYMVGAVFNIYKSFNLYRDLERNGEWKDLGEARCVAKATILSLGLGDIGGNFSRSMKKLGCKVIGVRKDISKCPDYVDEIVSIDNLDEVIGKADVVAISIPDNNETRGMFSRERISKMKDGSVLINVGRGSIVDTEALCDALEEGKLSGAVLDVTDPEPLPSSHRLYKIPNAVVTPHISGRLRGMPETYRYFMEILLDNAKRYVEGRPLRNQVDLKTGYRVDTP